MLSQGSGIHLLLLLYSSFPGAEGQTSASTDPQIALSSSGNSDERTTPTKHPAACNGVWKHVVSRGALQNWRPVRTRGYNPSHTWRNPGGRFRTISRELSKILTMCRYPGYDGALTSFAGFTKKICTSFGIKITPLNRAPRTRDGETGNSSYRSLLPPRRSPRSLFRRKVCSDPQETGGVDWGCFSGTAGRSGTEGPSRRCSTWPVTCGTCSRDNPSHLLQQAGRLLN